jgi:hypothetical protein
MSVDEDTREYGAERTDSGRSVGDTAPYRPPRPAWHAEGVTVPPNLCRRRSVITKYAARVQDTESGEIIPPSRTPAPYFGGIYLFRAIANSFATIMLVAVGEVPASAVTGWRCRSRWTPIASASDLAMNTIVAYVTGKRPEPRRQPQNNVAPAGIHRKV